jgi:hypothetical protein
MPGPPASEALPLRRACAEDLAAIESLIARSARELSVGVYTDTQVTSLLRYVFGADTQRIRDGTYYVIEAGFRRLALVATMPGEPLYRALGFELDERFVLTLPDSVEVPVARMSRSVTQATAGAET